LPGLQRETMGDKPWMMLIDDEEDKTAERIADDAGEGGGGEEDGRGTGAVFVGHPVGEIEDDSGEKAGLGDAQEETEPVKGGWAAGEYESHGDEAPGDHDACHPAARADAFLDEVGGEFEEAVAEEKDGDAGGVGACEAVDAAVGLFHLDLGDGDV